MRAIVAGGGIGGIAAAILLRRAGLKVTVLERRRRQETEEDVLHRGAGLTLFPNGTLSLRDVGADRNLPERVSTLRRFRLRTWRGAGLRDFDCATLADRFGAEALPMHRADLHTALLATLGADDIVFGTPVEGYEDLGDHVVVGYGEGAEVQADILVGADGIGSVVRAQMRGDAPVFSGITSWRGVVAGPPPEMEPGEGGAVWGPGHEFGWMPMMDGRVYWWTTKRAPADDFDPDADPRPELARRFADWPAPISALIEATPCELVVRSDLYDLEPAQKLTEGRVALLGDAGHAMQPHLAQGACQALEDAVTLARCLAGAPEPAAALREYERRRLPRVSALQRSSRRAGRDIHLESPFACLARNLLVKLVPPALQPQGPLSSRTLRRPTA